MNFDFVHAAGISRHTRRPRDWDSIPFVVPVVFLWFRGVLILVRARHDREPYIRPWRCTQRKNDAIEVDDSAVLAHMDYALRHCHRQQKVCCRSRRRRICRDIPAAWTNEVRHFGSWAFIWTSFVHVRPDHGAVVGLLPATGRGVVRPCCGSVLQPSTS